ncbi:PAS domain-containing protein [Psychromonas sp. KJ10-10]|uniref:PAS domain-containing protein n=1 Tax=Psychromonas sp. KJ10-10 TaxID=3391823 RepID=UPI0039B4CBC9
MLLANKARKKKHISLSGQENVRLSATLNAICDAIITTDTNEIVTYLNPVASQLTSWSSKEAIGKPLTDVFNIIHKHSREPVQNSAKDVLKTGENVALLANTVLICKDGNEYEISNSCSLFLLLLGKLVV